MQFRIKIALFTFMTFTCCTSNMSIQKKFVERNGHINFAVFKGWDIEPRDENRSTAFFMKYVVPFISDTSNDKISLIVYAQIYSSDSTIYNISISYPPHCVHVS
jgi:hypothetical protein